MIDITLTGADERTSIDDLLRLTKAYPCLEIGLLYTENPEGRNRYPSKPWLIETLDAIGYQCAIHVCGKEAQETVLSDKNHWTRGAFRLQMNRRITKNELWELSCSYTYVITQWSHNNTDLVDAPVPGHRLLVDSSGGRGRSPEKWERPITKKPVGFAGGLGLDNLHIELPKIMEVATSDWWIDMEGKLRVDDWFSIDVAERIIEKFLKITRGG